MNKNILIVLAGGFLIAILVAVLVQAALSGSKKEEMDLARIEILVAAKKLSVGREIHGGDLKWQTWPEDALFPGAITRDAGQMPTDAIKGKLLRPLTKGQPVHLNVVVEDDRGDFLSANVRKGMRAVGISVRSYVLADRLIRPGDFVDVIVTYRVRVNTRTNPEAQSLVNRYASETVIENVRVLAVDRNDTKAVDEEEDGGKKKKKKKSKKKAIVTLEVTPDGAEKLALSGKMGSISLSMRSIGDNSDQGTDRITTDVEMSRVMTNLSNMSGTSSSSSVRIYEGDQMTEVKGRSPKTEKGVDFAVEDAPTDTDNLGDLIMKGIMENISAPGGGE